MGKRLSVVGNVHLTPAGSLPGGSGDLDLGVEASVSFDLVETVSFVATTGSPLVLAGPIPATLVALRVITGGPVTLMLTSAAGADQLVTVADRAYLYSGASPYTAVKLAGTATVAIALAAA